MRKAIVFTLCSYEAAALVSRGKIPTLTRIAHRYRRRPLGLAVIGGLLGWLAHHLLLEQPPD